MIKLIHLAYFTFFISCSLCQQGQFFSGTDLSQLFSALGGSALGPLSSQGQDFSRILDPSQTPQQQQTTIFPGTGGFSGFGGTLLQQQGSTGSIPSGLNFNQQQPNPFSGASGINLFSPQQQQQQGQWPPTWSSTQTSQLAGSNAGLDLSSLGINFPKIGSGGPGSFGTGPIQTFSGQNVSPFQQQNLPSPLSSNGGLSQQSPFGASSSLFQGLSPQLGGQQSPFGSSGSIFQGFNPQSGQQSPFGASSSIFQGLNSQPGQQSPFGTSSSIFQGFNPQSGGQQSPFGSSSSIFQGISPQPSPIPQNQQFPTDISTLLQGGASGQFGASQGIDLSSLSNIFGTGSGGIQQGFGSSSGIDLSSLLGTAPPPTFRPTQGGGIFIPSGQQQQQQQQGGLLSSLQGLLNPQGAGGQFGGPITQFGNPTNFGQGQVGKPIGNSGGFGGQFGGLGQGQFGSQPQQPQPFGGQTAIALPGTQGGQSQMGNFFGGGLGGQNPSFFRKKRSAFMEKYMEKYQ